MLIAAVALLCASVFPQPIAPPTPPPPLTPDTLLVAADLQSDLAILRRAYSELHPGLYRSNTPLQVASAFDRLSTTWSKDRSLRDAYLDLAAVLASFKCGHSYPNFINQPKPISDALFNGTPRVPFAFRWIDREIVVTRNFSGVDHLTPGSTVTAINGVPSATILDALTTYARADGGNDLKRINLLDIRADEPLETFDLFFALRFPVAPLHAASYTLDLRTSAGTRKSITVPALSADERAARAKASMTRTRSASPEFSFAIDGWSAHRLPDRAIVLRMDHWVVYKTTTDWRAALNSFMDTIAKDGTQNLILDLRANEGGNDCGDIILARLIDKPIVLPSSLRHVRYSAVPSDINPFLDTWDDSFRDWKAAATPSPRPPALLGTSSAPNIQFFRLRRDNDDDPGATLSPSPGPRFTGKLWVLVSSTNSSATFQFAATVKSSKLGTLVGTTTGGNQRGINGGCFFFVRLPKSGFEVDLPLIAYTPCTPDGSDLDSVPDAGLEPDIRVATTAHHITSGIDPELEAVLSAISATNPTK